VGANIQLILIDIIFNQIIFNGLKTMFLLISQDKLNVKNILCFCIFNFPNSATKTTILCT